MTFKDKNGREWSIKLDAPICREVKQLGLDLVDLKRDPIAILSFDPLLLADVGWLLVRDEATAAGITSDQFQKGLDGDANSRLLDAITEAVVNFSPAGARSFVRSQLQANEETQRKGEEMAIQKLTTEQPKMLKAMERMIDRRMEKALSELESTDPSNTSDSMSPTSSMAGTE